MMCNSKRTRSLPLEAKMMPREERLVEAWPQIAGPLVERYTLNTYIYNQVLFVRLSSPALRAELSMRRQELVTQLNQHVGSQVITDIRFC